MNSSATIHAQPRHRAPRRTPLYNDAVLASLPLDPQKQIVFSDDLIHRWERIVLGDRA